MEASARRKFPALIERLLDEGPRYDFYQAVRLAEEALGGGERGGRLPEGIRLRPAAEISFPGADIRRCRQDEEGRLEFQLSFLGLYGVDAPVPHTILEAVAGEDESSVPLRDFLDIFNARLYQHLYLGWKKFRPVGVGKEGTIFELYLDALGGGTGENGGEEHLFARAFAGRVRNAEGLAGMLSEFLEASVQVRQFRPRWIRLGGSSSLGNASRPLTLGQNAVLGDRVLDISRRVEIRIGPVDAAESEALLPGSAKGTTAIRLIRRYLPAGVDFEIRLLVRSGQQEARVLGTGAIRLGWNSPLGREVKEIREIPLPAGKMERCDFE